MTGGLEFGFAAVSDTIYVDIFKDVPTVSRPHGTLKYTIKKLLGMMDQEILAKGLEEQKQLLQFRAQRLSKVTGCIFLHIELP
jgi:methionine S-methyltransferase